MNTKNEGIDPNGALARVQIIDSVWALAQLAMEIGRRSAALLVLGFVAVVTFISAGRAIAQTFTTLHTFTAASGPFPSINSDGVTPYAGLTTNSSGNTLYGTTSGGGSSGGGTVFAINTDGAGFTNLHSFTAAVSDPSTGAYTNSEGAGPEAGLILSGDSLYGTASGGGSAGYGTVFKLNINGTGFTNLHSFAGSDGFVPFAGLALSGNTLYGTAYEGGIAGGGTVFKLTTNGTGFTKLHSFTVASLSGGGPFGTNSDGVGPWGGLILSGNSVYGTAQGGGVSGFGTVFKVNINGTGFTNLHSFKLSEGANLRAGLILSGSTLYGTASGGGSLGNYGTLFAVNTDGTGFTNLHNFTATSGPYPPTNSDGVPYPGAAGLIVSGNTLYGTTSSGGSSGRGTIFAVNTDGTGFTTVHSFTAASGPSFFSPTNSEGAGPQAGLILSGNTLYGTAQTGGSSGNGTVFSLSFRPQLTIVPSGTNVILSWPISYAGFSSAGYYLQDTADLLSPAGWSAADPFLPTIINGQLTVTRPMLGPQRSYRLSQ